MTTTPERSVPEAGVHRRGGGRQGLPRLRPPAGSTTSRRRSASRATTRTSPSRCSPTRGTTWPRAGCTASPTASGGYPLEWTALKAWGSDRPVPERGPGSGGQGYDWPAHGWHEFRDPNEEWELTLYRYNANVVRQLNQNIDAARQAKAFEQWNPNWVRLRRPARRRVDARRPRSRPVPVRQRQPPGADEHAQQRDLGEQHAPDPGRPGPRAVQPDADRGDRRLRRHGPPGDVERGPGVAGRARDRPSS